MFRKDGVDYTNDKETADVLRFGKFYYFSKLVKNIYKNHVFCRNQNDLMVLINAWNRSGPQKYWVQEFFMSSLIVEVVEVKEILEHSNADRLEIAKVKGWESVVQKGTLKPGDGVVYVPIDAVLPVELSDKLGVTNYLSHGRVRTAKLRGVYSQGLIIDMKHLPGKYNLGDDVKEVLGITKYIPPPPPANLSGKQRRAHPDFHRYTDIENIKNFPDVLKDGEMVTITEKIHGTNFRSGKIRRTDIQFDVDFELHVGTHNTNLVENPDNSYWKAALMYNLKDILRPNMVIYGEVYGYGVQKLTYDLETIDVAFFDLMVDGRYINTVVFKEFCEQNKIPQVPILYEGPWDASLMDLANGSSTIAKHIREGIVIKPQVERYDSRVGRVAMKHLSEKYLLKDYGDLKQKGESNENVLFLCHKLSWYTWLQCVL